jgi:hypothetical protein
MGFVEIVDAVGFLLGNWWLSRSIEDHQLGIHASFQGTAELFEDEPGSSSVIGGRAHYEEKGDLHYGSYRGPASRKLEYVRSDHATAMLYFADGRPFVDLDLRNGTWRSSHLCGHDHYEISTLIRSSTIVSESWRVWGPSTNYEAATTFTRRLDPERTTQTMDKPV